MTFETRSPLWPKLWRACNMNDDDNGRRDLCGGLGHVLILSAIGCAVVGLWWLW